MILFYDFGQNQKKKLKVLIIKDKDYVYWDLISNLVNNLLKIIKSLNDL